MRRMERAILHVGSDRLAIAVEPVGPPGASLPDASPGVDQSVLAVEHHYPTVQLRHVEEVSFLGEAARRAEEVLPEGAQVLTLQRINLNPMVAAIGDEEFGHASTPVDEHGMRMPVPPRPLLAGEGLQMLAIRAEAVHEGLPVTVRDPDIPGPTEPR